MELCLCIVYATSHCSACRTITSAWCGEACGVFICFNIPAGVCFLIVHEQLHTSTKLTLLWCFCNVSFLFVFQFHCPPLTPLFPPFTNLLIFFSLTPLFCETLLNLSSFCHYASHLGVGVHLLGCLPLSVINCLAWSERTGLSLRMVYRIWCLGKQICYYFYVIKKNSCGLAFHSVFSKVFVL